MLALRSPLKFLRSTFALSTGLESATALVSLAAPLSSGSLRFVGHQVRHRENARPFAARRIQTRSIKRAAKRTPQQSLEFSYVTDRIFHPVVLSVALSPHAMTYCSMDAGGVVLDWGVQELPLTEGDLTRMGPSIDKLHSLVNSPLFKAADKVVIENQAGGKMRQMEAYLHAFLYERALLVRPQASRAHFGVKIGTLKTEKSQMVERCMEMTYAERERMFLSKASQKESLANVYLLVKYAHAAGLHRKQHNLKDTDLKSEHDPLVEMTKPAEARPVIDNKSEHLSLKRAAKLQQAAHQLSDMLVHPHLVRARVEVVDVK